MKNLAIVLNIVVVKILDFIIVKMLLFWLILLSISFPVTFVDRGACLHPQADRVSEGRGGGAAEACSDSFVPPLKTRRLFVNTDGTMAPDLDIKFKYF